MSNANELVELQETLYRSKNPTRRWLHCTRRDWVVEALHRCCQSPISRSLEVGPGSGVYLPELARLSEEVIASDIETAYLDHSRQLQSRHPKLKCIVDDITNTQLPEESFDLILCTEVIEHIKDSRATLAGLFQLLKPQGKLVLTTPQRWSFLELTAKVAFLPVFVQIVRLIYGEPILEMGHINLMTEKQLTQQLHSTGFKIIESHKSGLYLPIIAEILGKLGLHLEIYLESRIINSPLNNFLWTQYYILEKSNQSSS